MLWPIVQSGGNLVSKIIPELELVVGELPPSPELDPIETRNRLRGIFRRTLHVLCRPEHPVVFFFDDLQWSDTASLELLELMIGDENLRFIFIILAYRDEKEDINQKLQKHIPSLYGKDVPVHRIALKPLQQNAAQNFVVDALKTDRISAEKLGKLLVESTEGYPLHLANTLLAWHSKEILRFNDSLHRWVWDTDKLHEHVFHNSPLKLIEDKLKNLGQHSLLAVSKAACIGYQFEIELLSLALDDSIHRTHELITPAIEQGMLRPTDATHKIRIECPQGQLSEISSRYKFSHDRIQLSAFQIIPEETRRALHLKIARIMLDRSQRSKRNHDVLIIANHLHKAKKNITQPGLKHEAACINLEAGEHAFTIASFNYLNRGISLLEPDKWHAQYELTRKLYLKAAEAAFLIGKLDIAHELANEVIGHAGSKLDRVSAHEIKIQLYIASNQLKEATRQSRDTLNLLGVHLPEHVGKLCILKNFLLVRSAIGLKSMETLAELPRMSDPKIQAIMRLLQNHATLVYRTAPDIIPLVASMMVRFSVKYGNCQESGNGYVFLGLMYCGIFQAYKIGYKFGQLALKIIEQFESHKAKARALTTYCCFISHWKEHGTLTQQFYLDAYHHSMECGDRYCASFSAWCYLIKSFWLSENLDTLLKVTHQYAQVSELFRERNIVNYLNIVRQGISNFLGHADDPQRLTGRYLDEARIVPECLQVNDRSGLFLIYLYKMMLAYLSDNLPAANAHAETNRLYLDYLLAAYPLAMYHFYACLVRLSYAENFKGKKRRRFIQKAKQNLRKMKKWAHLAPMNFRPKYCLMKAEWLRVAGRHDHAAHFYEQAIQLAHDYGYNQEKALAYELFGKSCLRLKKYDLARIYLHNARELYEHWGARIKVELLNKKYADLLAISDKEKIPRVKFDSVDRLTEVMNPLDLVSIIKAAQAISKEMVKTELVKKLTAIVLENAGAQKCILILNAGNKLTVEAEGTINKNVNIRLPNLPMREYRSIPVTMIQYVARVRKTVLLADASRKGRFTHIPYVKKHKPKSVLCLPMLYRNKLSGILYLENNLVTGAFTEDHLKPLKMLCVQATISLENARLYEKMEDQSYVLAKRVEERTVQLKHANLELSRLVNARTREMKSILKHSPNAVYIKDTHGRYVMVNRMFEILYSVSAENIYGKTDDEIFSTKMGARNYDIEYHVMKTLENIEIQEKVLQQDGEHTFLSRKFPLYDESGTVFGIGSMSSDVTELKRTQQQLRRLSAHIMETQEKERAVIARELHDELGQLLNAMLIECAWLADHLVISDPKAYHRTATIADLIERSSIEVRNIALNLRPGILDELGLVDALQWCTQEFQKRHNMSCKFIHKGVLKFDETISIAAYRIVQEALTNVSRYAGATSITVESTTENNRLVILIADNGCGFDLINLKKTEGLGIAGMRERAMLAGGELTVISSPGKGTQIRFDIPFVEKPSVSIWEENS